MKYKIDKRKIGKRMHERRASLPTKKERSQEAFAEALDYEKRAYGVWERGQGDPPLDALLKICELCDCEIGYLVGEFDTPHRATNLISEETGLTVEAADKLVAYKRKERNFSFRHGGFASNEALDHLGYMQYVNEADFIPALLSYMLTDDRFTRLINRICAQNRTMWEYSILPDVKKKIINNAYRIALDRIRDRPDRIDALKEEYEKAIGEYMADHKEEILKEMQVSFSHDGYEAILILEMKRTFMLAHAMAQDTVEMNTFLNSRDLFEIVREFMEPLSNYK